MAIADLPTRQNSSDSQTSKNNFIPWIALWLCLIAVTTFYIGSDWILCLSQKPWTDNVLPLLTGVFLAANFRRYLASQPSFPDSINLNPASIVFLAVSALVVSAADYLHFSRLTWLGFLGMVSGLALVVRGTEFFRHWSPAILFSMFLIPGAPLAAIDYINAFLQSTSIKLALFFSSLIIPIRVENFTFFVRGEPFEVGTACSGLSMIVSLTFMLLLWNLFRPVRLKSLALLMMALLPIAMIMNGIRIALTAIIAYYQSKEVALAAHSFLEAPLFILAIAALGAMILRSKSSDQFALKDENNQEPKPRESKPREQKNKPNPIFSTLVSAILILPIATMTLNPSVDSKKTRCSVPMRMESWTGRDIPWTDLMKRNYKHVDVNITWREYKKADEKPIYCLVQQASNFENVHDVFACLKLVGATPSQVETGYLSSDSPSVLPPQYGIYEYSYRNNHFYTLFLFQSKAGMALYPPRSVSDRVKVAILGRIPCRLVELSTLVDNQPRAAKARLKFLAQKLATLPI